MHTVILPANLPEALLQAQSLLLQGQLVAFPTDTVYGLAAALHNQHAIEQLYLVKGRESTKAIAVLLGNPADLDQVTSEVSPAARRLARRFWPGALTLVVPRHPGLPEILSPLPTIGVRMPDHPVALALLNATGPLAVTSANLSGLPSAVTAEQVQTQLGGLIPLILDGGRTPGGQPSTVVDCTGAEIKIIRAGPLSLSDLRAALD